MSNLGRSIIGSLKQGDYHVTEQYPQLEDQDVKILNHYAPELAEIAVQKRDADLLQAILEIPQLQFTGQGFDVVLTSAREGLVEFLQLLARSGKARANSRDGNNNTALHAALLSAEGPNKALSMTESILQLPEVQVNARGGNGKKTPMHLAIAKGWYKVISLLMDHGGNPKIEDGKGDTVLALALADNSLPPDIFSRMLSFEGPDMEEMEEDLDGASDPVATSNEGPQSSFPHVPPPLQASPQDYSQAASNTPGTTTTVDDPPPQQHTHPANLPEPIRAKPKSEQEEPRIKQVITSAIDPSSASPDTPAKEPAQPRMDSVQFDPPSMVKSSGDDLYELFGAADKEAFEDAISHELLMGTGPSGDMLLLHHPLVLSRLDEVAAALGVRDEGISASDLRQKDPVFENTFWHNAAKTAHFPKVLDLVEGMNLFPETQDLTRQNAEGMTALDVLTSSGMLRKALEAPAWNSRPGQLALILSNLSPEKRKNLSTLVSRLNLILMQRVKA